MSPSLRREQPTKGNTMKTMLLSLICISLIGCATASPRTSESNYSASMDRATVQCAYMANVPRNITQAKRRAYLDKIAIPACLRAMGFDVAVGDLRDLK